MQVSVESVSTLERRMTITLPPERMAAEVDKSLKKLSRTAKIDGFRPGKVPMKVVQNYYGASARQNALQTVIASSLQEALDKNKLFPAGAPNIESIKDDDGQALEYVAFFEVFPEIMPVDFAGTPVERINATISEADVDEVCEKLRKQYAQDEDKTGPAELGDTVEIDCEATLDGEEFAEGSFKGMNLELGSHSTIPGFEDGLVGILPDQERTLNLTFPDDYHAEKLTGKPVQFTVKAIAITTPALPELNDDFAKKLNIKSGNIVGLRAEIRKTLERELSNVLLQRVKQQVLKKLLEQNNIAVPKALIREEAIRLQQEMQQRFKQYSGKSEAFKLPLELFEAQAKQRVSLGLLLPELVKKFGLELDATRVKHKIVSLADAYDDSEELINWYYQSKERLAEVQALVLEEQLVEVLLEQAAITEKTITYQEVIQLQQQEAEEARTKNESHDSTHHHHHDDHDHSQCEHEH